MCNIIKYIRNYLHFSFFASRFDCKTGKKINHSNLDHSLDLNFRSENHISFIEIRFD